MRFKYMVERIDRLGDSVAETQRMCGPEGGPFGTSVAAKLAAAHRLIREARNLAVIADHDDDRDREKRGQR